MAVESIDVELDERGLQLVANLCGEHLLVLQVAHEVIVHLCGLEGGTRSGSLQLIAGSQQDGVSLAQVEVYAGLGSSVEELSRAALAVGVLGGQSVAHLTFALHGGPCHASVDKEVSAIEVGGVSSPELSLVDEDVVVIAEAVAFLHHLVGMVHVVLRLLAVLTVVLDDVGVDIMEGVGAEQVVHRLIVQSLVGRELQSGV